MVQGKIQSVYVEKAYIKRWTDEILEAKLQEKKEETEKESKKNFKLRGK